MAIEERKIARPCWICEQPHNPDKAETRSRLFGFELRCRHREPEVELALERALTQAIEAREAKSK